MAKSCGLTFRISFLSQGAADGWPVDEAGESALFICFEDVLQWS